MPGSQRPRRIPCKLSHWVLPDRLSGGGATNFGEGSSAAPTGAVDIRDRRGGAGHTGCRAQVFFLTLMRSS